MNLRHFLLRLHLTRGIGLRGEYLVAQWLADHPGQLKQLLPQQIVKIAGILPRFQRLFEQDFISMRVSTAVERHLNSTQFMTIFDDEYPLLLHESWLPPVVLFYQGNINLLRSSSFLGIVGTRRASPYAKQAIEQFLPAIIQRSMVIVSGLATGVDHLSHQLALQNGGHTIGVIGTGLNLSYPASSQKLQQYMAQHELVLSEYPLDAAGRKHHFVERNRIIAGLSQSVVVIQAKAKSGSLITANLALQNNRNVLAVPGRIDDELSTGCNQLIQAGAKPVLKASDILEDFPQIKG
ncbi:DNA protecting protein DprA [Secundilactobacillus odoratitofui DSM 19909 = JCM 15043]|uniref:DNA protecting protein DprA n=1 Tax=Secundilactobacillus odoratitofui DSM 19909 = JCM 15043 TaxID=1423776 RepID=A0A0R1LQW6_9LACO|nr:DNA-processing protein DprA [Secundilactobacillus odoratitofui]KRK98095.1 DNA protecting protein DprA [Secundilactobacillus odoratitofui DSM 19909 = JCM 15043]